VNESASQSLRNSSTPSNNTNWTNTHVQFYQAEEMRDCILLDNESTASIFCNRNYVQDITESQEELILATNGGKLTTKLTATVPGYPIRVWYNPKAIANMFAFHEMEKLYRITYDSKKEKAFIVHLEEGRKIKFRQAPNGLYYHKPKELNTQKNIENGTNMMNTVEENKRFFTNRQIARAYKARELYHALGTPSIHDFKATIIMNAIKNNPVTLEDVKISEMIFGPDIGRIRVRQHESNPIQ
jgi:hypothetical protein